MFFPGNDAKHCCPGHDGLNCSHVCAFGHVDEAVSGVESPQQERVWTVC